MTTVEVVLQAARERVPGATPRIISDNGPQFMAKDFKEFIRLCTMTHVRTSPFYPQSNGKLEPLTKSLKGGVYSAQLAGLAERCTGLGSHLRRTIQHRAFA